MKQHRIRFLLLTIATSVLLGYNARAAVLLSSQFVGYDTGNLGADANTGTLDNWQGSTAQVTVTNGSGSLTGTNLGLVASAGDRIFISASNTLSCRNQFATNTTFPQTVDTNLYYSFLYKFKSVSDVSANGEILMRINRANSGTGTAQHWDLNARSSGGLIQLGIAKAGAPSNVTNWASANIGAGTNIFVVVRQHIIPGAQNDVYDLWINPAPQFFGTNETDIPPSDASVGALTTDGTEDASGTGPGRCVLASGANAEFDEFRITTTWAEATPWFGQCVSAGSAAGSPSSVTNSAEINAAFKVNPLGTSPTVQWQLSINGGTVWNNITGGDSSTYITPNLPLSANGYKYRAIISVACNSSTATSQVATVTLTTPTSTANGTLMDDIFTRVDRSAGPLTPTNSLWYTAGTLTANLTTVDGGLNPLGFMQATPISGGSSLWLGYYTETNALPVHLAIGKQATVTMRFTPTAFSSFTNNAGLRIGLFDYYDSGSRITADSGSVTGSGGNGVNVRGYMLNLDFGPTFSANSPLQLLVRNSLTDNNLLGTVADYDSLGSGPAGGGYSNAPAFQAGTEYTLVFNVARTDTDSVDVTTTITGGGTNWSHSVTETNFAYHRFDAIGIRPNSLETSADAFNIAELKVEVSAAVIPVTPFTITAIQALSAGPGSVKITWNSVSGINYQIQSRTSLSTGNWATNATVLANSASTSYTNSPGPVATQFYRVVATP